MTAYRTAVSAFVCPSDFCSVPYTNYAGNLGGYRNTKNFSGVFYDSDHYYLPLAAIGDGLSQTVAVAEWLTSLAIPDRRRQAYSTILGPGPFSIDSMIARCWASKSFIPENSNKGNPWHTGSWGNTLYDHAMVINGPNCLNDSVVDVAGSFPAGSLHPGGANVLFADAHVSFVKDSTEAKLWRVLGTRNGGELVNPSAY